jgi:murein DD-endopeptidase MepM/ murein hydrolase activator NlpD
VRLGILASVFLATAVGGFFPVNLQSGDTGPRLAAAAFSIPGLPASVPPSSSVNSIGAQPVPLTIHSPAVSQVAVTPAASLMAARAAAGSGSTALSREREQVPIFYRYEVKVGDTVAGIATQFGVARDYIIWNNVEVQDEDHLRPGQLLQVPSVEGIIHSVRLNETLTEIADHYDAKVADIIAFPANGLTNPNRLPENGIILVPGGRITPKPAPSLRPDPPSLVTAPNASQPAPAPVGWIWPLSGLLTSNFGPSHPLGIDISAPFLPVAASQGGVVVFAGGDRCCSYGLYVEIQHTGGYSTRYAHLSEIRVSLGQVVNQGQLLGVSGNTGFSTGPHLHFEMRRNGQIVNPLSFLP